MPALGLIHTGRASGRTRKLDCLQCEHSHWWQQVPFACVALHIASRVLCELGLGNNSYVKIKEIPLCVLVYLFFQLRPSSWRLSALRACPLVIWLRSDGTRTSTLEATLTPRLEPTPSHSMDTTSEYWGLSLWVSVISTLCYWDLHCSLHRLLPESVGAIQSAQSCLVTVLSILLQIAESIGIFLLPIHHYEVLPEISTVFWHNPKIGENQKWKFSFFCRK